MPISKKWTLIGPELDDNNLDHKLSAKSLPIFNQSSNVLHESVQSSYQIIGSYKIKHLGKYFIGDEIGHGSFGKVKDCMNVDTLELFAIKILRMSRLKKIPKGKENLFKEIRLLQNLRHLNIIGFVEIFEKVEKAKWYIVLELCVASVQDLVDVAPTNCLSEYQAHMYYTQVLSGLVYMHSCGVFHMDIKPSNLLLTADHVLKISDFGVAEVIDKFTATDFCFTCQGSPMFQPPECASGEEYFSGSKVDVWASGVTLFYISSGSYPFASDHLFTLYESISSGKFIMPSSISNSLSNLLSEILKADPAERYSIDDIYKHEWFKLPHNITSFINLSLAKTNHNKKILKKLNALHFPDNVSRPQSEEVVMRIINHQEIRNNK